MVKNIKMQTQYGESIVIIAIFSMNRIKYIVQERSRSRDFNKFVE